MLGKRREKVPVLSPVQSQNRDREREREEMRMRENSREK